MTDFQRDRREQDAALLAAYGMPRTRSQAQGAAALLNAGDVNDPLSDAGRVFGELFCAAARLQGAAVCDACGNLTLHAEQNHGHRYMVCDECQGQVDDAIRALPAWVKDRDLNEVIPALVRAYIRTKHEVPVS